MSEFFKVKNITLALIVFAMLVVTALYLVFSGTAKNQITKFSEERFYSNEPAIENCKNLTQGQAQCWEDLMIKLVNEKGVAAALDVLSTVSDTYEPFFDVCHDLTHTIGGEAYKQFLAGEDFLASPKSVYCNYGFYHGFMETLANKAGNPEEARKFCAYIDKKMAEITPDVSLQCYHGIGHGWTNVHSNPESWGDERAIVAPALELCEEVKDTWEQLSRCLTGVFHGIAVLYVAGDYELSINKDDPLWLCHEQSERYKNECYISMYGVLRHVTQNNFSQAAKFIEDISEDKYAGPAIKHLAMATSAQNINKVKHIDGVNLCRSLEERLRNPCIEGYAFGLFEQNTSGEEYKRPLNFCRLETLSEEERTACLEYIFSYLDSWYPRDKAYQICETVEAQYREFCHAQTGRSGT